MTTTTTTTQWPGPAPQMTPPQKRDAMLHSFFAQYDPFLKELDKVPDECPLSLGMMILSTIDFYGKIYRTGEYGFPPTKRGERNYNEFNNSEQNYVSFIQKFFPKEHKCKGIILFRIYRCGIMHQIVPKGAGVVYDPKKIEMFFPDPSNPEIPVLNLFPLKVIVKKSIQDLKVYLIDPENILKSVRIYDDLIHYPDGFGDFYKLEKAIKCSGLVSIYDDCNDSIGSNDCND